MDMISLTKDVEKGTDDLADTLLMEKKYCSKNFEKGTDKWADTLLMEKKSSSKNIEKGTDELAYTLLAEKKSSTNDVDKGTDELEFMKQKMDSIRRKGLDKFEGQYIVSNGWVKLDIELKKIFLKVIQSSIKNC